MFRYSCILISLFITAVSGLGQDSTRIFQKDTIQITMPIDTTNLNNIKLTPPVARDESILIVFDILKDQWETFFSMGAVSFADSVIHYDPGALGEHTGDEPHLKYQNTVSALGMPNYDAEADTGFVSLGNGGCLVLKFTDNLLIDGYGSDLYIFFSDTSEEEVDVLISEDGVRFRSVGTVTKQYPIIDIYKKSDPGGRYPYIKLRDNPDQGEKQTLKLGADIDAVGAMNTAMIFIIPADSLILNESSRLRPSAEKFLSPIAEQIRQLPESTVFIEAHTGDRGSEDYNLITSQRWTGWIRNYFLEEEQLTDVQYRPLGLGESKPISSNESEKGRRKNRRIEILIMR